MNTRISRLAAALIAAFMICTFTLPANAAPAAKASASPAAKAKAAKPAKTESVEGTITRWDDKSFDIKATLRTLSFTYDKAHFAQVGKAATGAKVKVWYHDEGKSKVATKVQVSKEAKADASPKAPKTKKK